MGVEAYPRHGLEGRGVSGGSPWELWRRGAESCGLRELAGREK